MKVLIVMLSVVLLFSCKELVKDNVVDLKKDMSAELADEFIKEVKNSGKLVYYFDKAFPEDKRDNKILGFILTGEGRDAEMKLRVTYKFEDRDINLFASKSVMIVTDENEYRLKGPKVYIQGIKTIKEIDANTKYSERIIEFDEDVNPKELTDKQMIEVFKKIDGVETDEEVDKTGANVISGMNEFYVGDEAFDMFEDMFASGRVLVRIITEDGNIDRIVSKEELAALKRVVDKFREM